MMEKKREKIKWAPRIKPELIQRLYKTDALAGVRPFRRYDETQKKGQVALIFVSANMTPNAFGPDCQD